MATTVVLRARLDARQSFTLGGAVADACEIPLDNAGLSPEDRALILPHLCASGWLAEHEPDGTPPNLYEPAGKAQRPLTVAVPTLAGVLKAIRADEQRAEFARGKAMARAAEATATALARAAALRALPATTSTRTLYLMGDWLEEEPDESTFPSAYLACATATAEWASPAIVASSLATDAERATEVEQRDAAITAARATARDTLHERLEEAHAWIASHGSERLRALVAEQIECVKVYRTERVAAECPGWVYGTPEGEIDEPRNAPADALAMLGTAREALPERDRPSAKLRYQTCDDGDEHHAYLVTGRHDLGGYTLRIMYVA